MMQIPLQSLPVQQIKTVVGGQNVQIYLRQKPQGLFVDVNANGADIATGALALNGVPIIARGYAGFPGNFAFVDTQGANDPDYSGFAERFALVYLTAEEYAQLQ